MSLLSLRHAPIHQHTFLGCENLVTINQSLILNDMNALVLFTLMWVQLKYMWKSIETMLKHYSVYLFDKENEMVLSLCLLTVYRSCTELKISQSIDGIYHSTTDSQLKSLGHDNYLINDVYLRILNACNVFIFLIFKEGVTYEYFNPIGQHLTQYCPILRSY